MPVFDVTLTVKAFLRQPDDSQIAVERVLAQRNGVIAATKEAAVAIAARDVKFVDTSDEVLGQATVTVRS
jgi:hypothetical protein